MEIQSFYQRCRDARRVVLVDLGFLGDSIHLIPALWEIRDSFPKANIEVVSSAVGADVLKMASCVDRVWTVPLGPKSPPWWRNLGILSQLRRERFDLAVNFSGADRAILMTTLTGAKWSLAREGRRRHFWNRWLMHDWIPLLDLNEPMFEQRRRVLAHAGFSIGPARFELSIPESARHWARDTMPDRSIHLSLSASTPLKEWPLESWIGLGKGLRDKHPDLPVIVSGSGSGRELERMEEFAKSAGNGRVHLCSGRTIAELAAVLERCRLHVGPDSGVLHLAAALGIPTVALFRDYERKVEWLPRGVGHEHLTAKCECMGTRSEPCLALGRSKCLGTISIADVLDKIYRQLGERF